MVTPTFLEFADSKMFRSAAQNRSGQVLDHCDNESAFPTSYNERSLRQMKKVCNFSGQEKM